MNNIRNFCIVAHIDHGKSTLADRFIQRAHLVTDREFHDQILDTMELERERGINIKSQAVSIPYQAADGRNYLLNLVDTPGHVDFSYEVSRALSACEGTVLLVDATQGVQAQTVSNLYMAMEHDLAIIPVINKIDLASADVEAVKRQIESDLGLDPEEALLISAKQGTGVEELLEAIVGRIPPPPSSAESRLRALIFDSHYDPYRGVVAHVRVFTGTVRGGDEIRLWSTGSRYKVEETGTFRIGLKPAERLSAGEVGYIIAGIKTISDTRVGDTVTLEADPCSEPLPGFREVKPVVFSSIYPLDANELEELVEAMEKLKLNDASLVYERDSSVALGMGFRCGFLGLLHLEIVQQRLEREFGLGILLTAPSVRYRLTMSDGSVQEVDNPADYPDPAAIVRTEEPYITAEIIVPALYLGNVISLCLEKRGEQEELTYLDKNRVQLRFAMPLADVLFDFYDRLKSVSRGYASFDYELAGYRETELAKLDILINGKPVDALAQLVYRGNAYARGRMVCRRLKEEIPRHQFKIPIQAAIGGTIIARETISALRKDVTAKCYGGDISRKRKLLERQKEGKKRMKEIGNVRLPQSAFLAALRTSDD